MDDDLGNTTSNSDVDLLRRRRLRSRPGQSSTWRRPSRIFVAARFPRSTTGPLRGFSFSRRGAFACALVRRLAFFGRWSLVCHLGLFAQRRLLLALAFPLKHGFLGCSFFDDFVHQDVRKTLGIALHPCIEHPFPLPSRHRKIKIEIYRLDGRTAILRFQGSTR